MKINNSLDGLIVIGIILAIGSSIREEIKKNHPEIHKQYLKDVNTMPWYKRMWYLK